VTIIRNIQLHCAGKCRCFDIVPGGIHAYRPGLATMRLAELCNVAAHVFRLTNFCCPYYFYCTVHARHRETVNKMSIFTSVSFSVLKILKMKIISEFDITYIAPQAVMLDFRFCPQNVLSLRGLILTF
jgi:hypothetical protein